MYYKKNITDTTCSHNLLIIGSLPPPLHGASIYFKQLFECKTLDNNFKIVRINLNFNNTIKSSAKFSIKKLLIAFGFYIKIIKVLIKGKIDIVYCGLAFPIIPFVKDAIIFILCRLSGAKVIAAILGVGFKKNAYSNQYLRKFYEFGLNLPHYLFTPSHHMIKEDGYPKKVLLKSIEVPFGIIPIMADTFVPDYNIVPDNFNILFMSNFIKEKGILDSIEAIKYVIKKFKNVKFYFAGKWEFPIDKEIADKILEDNALKNHYEFVGIITGEEKKHIMSKTHIFLLPTYYSAEGVPLAILDALSFGQFVITCRHGGISSIITENFNGLFCKPRDPKDLADKILFAIGNKDSFIRIRKNAFEEFKKNYTFKVFIENLIDKFNYCLNN